MDQPDLIPHLFRTEFRRITSVLIRSFGIAHMEVAEDLASETFLAAMETWPYKGIPANPGAWLHHVAKNKARTLLARDQVFAQKVSQTLRRSAPQQEEMEIDWSEQQITDSQLQMLFAIGHPAIPTEAQIGLALRILCGFGIGEIADAFLTSKETINKRLFRAREKLRNEQVPVAYPGPEEIPQRLDTVLTTLYLLFNEGYYSESQDCVLREDLCLEAMRLTGLLLDYPPTNLPPVRALLALMNFHASRFAARRDEQGRQVLYQDQDESRWDQERIAAGVYYLHQAAAGDRITRYHLEATIAWWDTQKQDTPEKWENILQLYNQLLQMQYSPIAALNRTWALAKARGYATAIPEAEKLDLPENPYLYTLLGELYTPADPAKARLHYEKALTLARTTPDREAIQKKLRLLPS